MLSPVWMVGLVLAGQVPEPPTLRGTAAPLRAARSTIIAKEGKALNALAERLARENEDSAAREVGNLIETTSALGGPIRFTPLPEIVAAQEPVPQSDAWRTELRKIRQSTAKALFDLARSTAMANEPRLALADST